MDEKLKNNRIVLISLFIAVEIMLLIALDLGGGSLIFKGVAALLAVILSIYLWKALAVDLSEGLYITLLPIVFYGFVTISAVAYGPPWFDNTGINTTVMNFPLWERVINMLGLIAIMLLGYFLRKTNVFSQRTVFLLIFAGLAVPVLISLFATLINYGFFHTIVHRDSVIFYGAQAYPIANQASMVVGFKIMTVDRSVLVTNALFITSGALGLLFLNKEKDRNDLLIISLISGIGLLTIILIGSLTSLLYLLPALIFVLLVKFNITKYFKNKIALITLSVSLGLGLLIFLTTAYNIFDVQALWQGNAITRKLFMNGKITRFYAIFVNGFTFDNFYGNVSHLAPYGTTNINVFPSGNVFFDSLWLDGILGVLALGVFAVFLIYRTYKYFVESSDGKHYKVMLVSFLLTIFAHYMFKYPFSPYIFQEDALINFFPLINNPIFLVTVFFAGYIFMSKSSTEVEK